MSGSIKDSEFDDTWVPPQDKSQDQYTFIWKPPWRKFNIRVCFPDGRISDQSSTYLVPLAMQFLMTHHLQRLQQMIRDIQSFHVDSILSSEELLEIKLKSHATEKILSEIEIVLANECGDITTRMVRKFPFTSILCEDLFKKSLKEETIDLVCDEANIFIVGHSKMKDFINKTVDEIRRVTVEKNYVLQETWQFTAVMKFQLLDEIAKKFSDLIISPQEGKCSVYFHGKDETVKKAVKELERLLSDLFVAKVECDPLIIKLLSCSDASKKFTEVLKKASNDVVWVVDGGKLSFCSKFQINRDLVRLLLYDNFMSVGFSGMTSTSFVTSKAFTDITKSPKTECIIQEKSASGINVSSTKKVVLELLHQEKMYYEYKDNSKETQVNTTDEEISKLRTTNKEIEKRLLYLESQLRKELSLKQDSETKLRNAEEKNSREFESRMKLQKELIAEREKMQLEVARLKAELKEKETTIVFANTEIQKHEDERGVRSRENKILMDENLQLKKQADMMEKKLIQKDLQLIDVKTELDKSSTTLKTAESVIVSLKNQESYVDCLVHDPVKQYQDHTAGIIMRKKKVYILDLCENDETRYIWKHIWKTQGGRIESDLQKKGISFIEDSQSTDPVAILDTPPIDTAIVLIRRVFNEKALGIRAKCHAIENGVDPQKADKVSTDDVGIYKGNKNEWWIVGSVEKIDNVIKSFHHAIDSVLKDKCNINQTDKTVDDTFEELSEPIYVQLREEEKAIMWIYNLLQNECLQQSSVDICYNRFDFKISVSDMSTKNTIEKQLRGKIDSYKTNIASKVLHFSPPVYKFILKDCVHEFVKSKIFYWVKSDCVWFKGSHNTITVYAENRNTVERKCKIIMDSIKEDSVAVPPRYFKTEEAVQKLSELENKQLGKLSLKLSTSCTTVNIVCTSDVSSSMANVQGLFSKRTFYVSRQKESICRIFFRKCKADLEEQLAVDISEASDNVSCRWGISGEGAKVKVALEELNKLQYSISSETKTYISDESLNTVRSKVKNINDNSSCTASILSDMEVSRTKLSSKNVTDLRLTIPCRSLQMADGHHITVYKCSLKENPWLTKDCLVVNVLSVSEKTSAAVCNIRKDDENNCYQGFFYLPDWKENVNKEKNALDKVLNVVMDIAKSYGKGKFMSLAFDLVEVNKLRWPGNKYLKGILYSIQTNKPAIDVQIHEYSEDKHERASKMIYDWCTAETRKIKPNLQITVVKGEIAKQKSDILVNSTNGTLILKQGIVSSSLLRAAGEEIQKECSRYLSSKGGKVAISYTEVVITSGYGLSCKKVFHGTLPHCGNDTNQNFEKFIQNCLRHAVALNVESISFPALGTGTLGYPPEVSAKIMFDVVDQFASSSKTGALRDVRFVIYPDDEKGVKAFEYEETKRNEKGLAWNEAKVANPDCLPFNVSVVGENTNSIQQTFKQIYDILKKKVNTKDITTTILQSAV